MYKRQANAQYNMGRCYEEGLGVSKDESKAFSWFLKAAKQNEYRAICCVGLYYMSGICVEKDEKKAFSYFEKAANAEIPIAQYNLAVMYQYGSGVEKDTAKSRMWMAKAAQHGFPLAIEMMKHDIEAVSYTHLDVYKRQVRRAYPPHIAVLKQFWKRVNQTSCVRMMGCMEKLICRTGLDYFALIQNHGFF